MILGDGHVMSHAIKTGAKPTEMGNGGRYGMIKARVDEVIYPDDERNSTYKSAEKRIEYTCTIIGGPEDGKKIFNVIDGENGGSQFNSGLQVRTPTTNSETKKSKKKEADSPRKTNGEIVRIQMMYGNGDSPIITGNMQSPLQGKIPKKEDGIFFQREFNGVVFTVDKDGAFSVSFTGGPKDKDGKSANEEAAGSAFSIDKNGNMSFVNGEGQSFKLDRENKTITMGSDGNSIEINTSSGNVTLGNKGSTSIESKGSTTIKSSGGATFSGSTTQIQNGGMPAARMGDQCFGIGNKGRPVISRVIQGSGSCLIGG